MRLHDVRGQFRITPRRLWKYVTRRAAGILQQWTLERRSKNSQSRLIDPTSDVIVTMTTHGQRVENVHVAIESIAAGTVLPSRLILYLDAPRPTSLPYALERLATRGLEIKYVEGNYGPHTKYFGYVEAQSEFNRPLVTADDDVIYPETWLEGLVSNFTESERLILCHRAHRIGLDHTGLTPYNSWSQVTSAEPSLLHFATGVSGVLYPPSFLRILKEQGDAFRDQAPKADDVWLHSVAVRYGYMIKQLTPHSLNLLSVRGTQGQSLQNDNVLAQRNDEQIKRTYTLEHLRILRGAARQEANPDV